MRRISSAIRWIVVAACALPPAGMAANEAFDQTKGALSVDYARYLSKHDLVFNKAIADSKNGMTVGNGRVGAMVWNANGINMQVTGVDASPQTCFSAGLINFSTSPAMDANSTTFQQALSMYDGLINARYDDNRTVTIMGAPNSEILGIHVEDKRAGVASSSFQISMWDPATQISGGGYDVPNVTTWKTVSAFADSSVAGISRGQADPNNFGYTLAGTVEGAAFTTQQVDTRTVRFTITPSSSYTIWIACSSRLNAPGNNSVTKAKTALAGVKNAGYAVTLAAYTSWWHAFWARSFVQYSNKAGDADYLESFYYLATYMIGSGAFGKYPFHFVNGVYRWNADMDIHWSNAYWYWNMRDVYDSFLASNHVDVMEGLYRLYGSNLQKNKDFTLSRFSIDGAWVPETMSWDGGANGTINSYFTKNIWTTGAEAASNMFLKFAYTNDSAYLKSTAYPYIRETAKFLQSKFTFDAATNTYYMQNSNAHETYWNVKNAITDLAAARFLFPMAIQTAKAFGLDADLQAKWQTTLDHLVPYKTEAYNGGSRYLAYDPPTVKPGNGENITSELIWPYGVTGIGASDYDIAVNSWKSRPFPYGNIWAPDAIQAARLGLGDDAFNGMKQMLNRYQTFPNGFTDNTNGVFEYIGVHLLALNESLMQSHDGIIRVFPAIPSDPDFTGGFTLLAKGGFLVSSEREAGETKYIGLKSLYGRPATVANPWGTQAVDIRKVSDGSVVSSSNASLSFNTAAGETYVIERTGKRLSAYAFATLTATGNGSAKTLVYNGKTMTLGVGQGKAQPVRLRDGVTQALPKARILKIAGARFSWPDIDASKGYAVDFLTLAGSRVKSISVRKSNVDVRADAGLPVGVYLVRVQPLAP